MRTPAVALLLCTLFSGCLAGDFHAVNEMATTLQAVRDGCEVETTFDRFAADARAQLVHVNVRVDGETKALPFDDAGDVITEGLRVLYETSVNERLVASPGGERLDQDHATLEFATGNGTLLPNMYDGCHPQWSNQHVHFLFVHDEELDLRGDILTCDAADEACSVRHSQRAFDALEDATRAAHEGVGA